LASQNSSAFRQSLKTKDRQLAIRRRKPESGFGQAIGRQAIGFF
jgi:hypothetical protein